MLIMLMPYRQEREGETRDVSDGTRMSSRVQSSQCYAKRCDAEKGNSDRTLPLSHTHRSALIKFNFFHPIPFCFNLLHSHPVSNSEALSLVYCFVTQNMQFV